MTLKHSIFLPTGFAHEFAGADPVAAFESLADMVAAADGLGFETAWVLDHFQTIPPGPAPLFECWTTVAALLRETSRLRIGQLVTGNGYRNPALQAKMASTADVLGNGRFTFGIGAGWYEPDYAAYGYAFGDAPARLRQLREAVQIILSLWTQDETTFDGDHYQVRGAIHEPKGVQRPHIPLLIAGGGEKVTLKLAAQYANACNVLESPAGLERKFAVLRSHCERVGREYDDILRSTATVCIIADTDEEARSALPPGSEFAFPGDLASYGLIGTPDTIRRRLADYEAAGVQELAISFGGPDPTETLRRYAAEFMSRTSPASSLLRSGTAARS
jgi:F420-dependent oxidoreductase-like protein